MWIFKGIIVMYILIVMLLSGPTPVELETQEFESMVNCMQAIEKLVGMESKTVKVRAFCSKK